MPEDPLIAFVLLCLSDHKHKLISINETEIDMNNSKDKLTEELANVTK